MSGDELGELPVISAIIPCYNEQHGVAACINSLLHNDYPADSVEILVVDGMSTDKTRDIVGSITSCCPRIKLIDNPRRHYPSAINLGIKSSKGQLIVLLGAHATYPADYLSQCEYYSRTYQADNVGGSLAIVPCGNTLMARAIALSQSHWLGAGNARYKTGAKEIAWTDTVFGGCYRRAVFDEVGLFDDNLFRASDIEFNLRLKRHGKRILLVPGIVVHYITVPTWTASCRRHFRVGYWVLYPLRFGRKLFSYRHVAPLAFVSSLLGLAGLSLLVRPARWALGAVIAAYLTTTGVASLQIARRERDPRLLATLPAAFVACHIPYGLGSLRALIDLLRRSAQR